MLACTAGWIIAKGVELTFFVITLNFFQVGLLHDVIREVDLGFDWILFWGSDICDGLLVSPNCASR